MSRVWAIASSVVADAVRRKVIYVVMLFAMIMAAAIPALPSYGVGVVEAVFREVALTLTYVAAIVVVLALAANRVPSEIERRTIYNTLSRDVRRWEYVVGTWLGIMLTMGGILLAFGLIAIGIGWLEYGSPMWRLLQGVVSIWFESGVIAAFCMAVSAAAGAVIVATAALVFIFVAHARSGLLAYDTVAYRLYPSMDAFNIINPVAHGTGITFAYAGSMTLVFLAWAAILLGIAAIVFSRRDL